MLRLFNKRTAALLVAAGCGAVLALGTTAPASAHAALVGTDPEDGATVDQAPAEVSATFSEILDGPSTEIAVTGPEGESLALDEAVFDGDTFTQPMLYTDPGEYTVAFRVISEDGHRVDESFAFTVEQVPEELLVDGAATEETGDDAEDTTAEAAPAPDDADEADQADEDEDSNTGAALAMILLGALVVVGAGILLVKFVGRKNKDDTTEQ